MIEKIEYAIIKYTVKNRSKYSNCLAQQKGFKDHASFRYAKKYGFRTQSQVDIKRKENENNRHHSIETRNKISFALKGKRKSNKAKLNMSKSAKGKIIPEEVRKKISSANTGKKRSAETKAKISGENSSRWQGGKSFLPYCPKFNRKLKEAVRNRDNRICQLCNEKENGRKLHIHHIHYDKENCNPDLIALCGSCNSKVNIRRDLYESLFMNKLNERGLLFWSLK